MTPTAEFSHIVTIEPWPADGIAVDLVATDAERQYLKQRFDLIDLSKLKGKGKIERTKEGFVFGGTLEADVVQTCVVTLKPISSAVSASFERCFRQADDEADDAGQKEMVLEGVETDVDLIEDNKIDIGEVIAEELCLALDPYPRAEDADAFMTEVQGSLDQTVMPSPDNPFAKLRKH